MNKKSQQENNGNCIWNYHSENSAASEWKG